MKLRLITLLISICISGSMWAQEIDPSSLLANTRTFIFDDGKNTVSGYIIQELSVNTTCCGEERIYLEVRIDPSGSVLSAKALTGKKEGCMAKSAVDIVKNVKWDASEFRGPKPVYFEVRPNIECSAERDNVYQPIEVINNEKLDEEGEKVVGDYQDVAATVIETEKPAEPVEEVTEAAEEVAEAATESAAAMEEAGVVTEPTEIPEPVVISNEPSAIDMEEEVVAVTNEGLASDTPPVQTEEIRILRENMAQMREQEEVERKKREARQAAIDRRNAEREAAMAARGESETPSASGNDWGVAPDITDEAAYGEEGIGGDGYEIESEIAQLESQRAELEQQKEQRIEEMRQREQENRQATEEIIQIEEQIIAKTEEAAQRQEEQELQAIEQEVASIDEQRVREEEEYQRMMDEIERLQQEADAKIQELEEKKAELARKQELQKLREQEIALARSLRTEQNKARMKEVEMSLRAGGNDVVFLGDAGTGTQDLSELVDIDLTAEADSEALRQILLRMQQMQREIELLQAQIRSMGEQPATGDPYSGYTPAPRPAGTKPKNNTRTNGSGTNGAADKSYTDLDIFAPGTAPEDYQVKQPVVRPSASSGIAPANPPQQVDAETAAEIPAYKPGKGYSPHPSHKETHANVEGPSFGQRTYVDGANAMKDLIKQQLRTEGICGLAQSFFSITLDPQGKVIDFKVLGANTEEVNRAISNIIPTLRFTTSDQPINETIYMQFKGEIVCEGTERVPLQDVQSIINE